MTLGTVDRNTPAIVFSVIGDQVPHGLRPVPRYGPGREVIGQALAKGRTPEQGRAMEAWAGRIAVEAGKVYRGPLLTGPLAVEFRFFRSRPQHHFGTGRNAGKLKPDAARYPIVRPDVLKVARVAEDALTGVVYADDAQIVEERLLKLYGEPARLEVEVYVLDPQARPLEPPPGQQTLGEEMAA